MFISKSIWPHLPPPFYIPSQPTGLFLLVPLLLWCFARANKTNSSFPLLELLCSSKKDQIFLWKSCTDWKKRKWVWVFFFLVFKGFFEFLFLVQIFIHGQFVFKLLALDPKSELGFCGFCLFHAISLK